MIMRTKVDCLIFLLLIALNCPVFAADPDYETVGPVEVETVLPPALLHAAAYSINAEVVAEDNFYHFSITSDYATYKVASVAMLRQRLFEIATIAEVRPRLEGEEARFDRNPGGRRGVDSEHVVDILSDPVGTAAQLLGNIQYNLEQTFDPGEDDAQQSVGAITRLDLNPSPHKRAAAAQLGVDVYSSNRVLQRLLGTVADARSAGDTRFSFSPLLRNPYRAPPFGSGVLEIRLDSRLKNTAGEEINQEVSEALVHMDVPPRTRIGFLTHKAFTPRTRLYFSSFIQLLGPVEHIDWLFEAANSAATEADALAYVNYARMLASYNLHRPNLTEVITQSRFPTVVTRANAAVLALPLDYLAWTETVGAAATALGRMREDHALASFTVLLAGQASPRARTELAARGVKLEGSYSF